MATLVLVRHGQTTWNALGRWQGLADVALTDQGRAEAKQAAASLHDVSFACAYASVLSTALRLLGLEQEILHGSDETVARLKQLASVSSHPKSRRTRSFCKAKLVDRAFVCRTAAICGPMTKHDGGATMRMAWITNHGPSRWMLVPLFFLGSSLILLTVMVPFGSSPARAAGITYAAALSGPAEFPSNNSTGTGFTRVDLDLSAHTMRVQVGFSGLVAPTTASHIHACTATAGTGTAGVATRVPFFLGFPISVTSGTYDHTYNTLDAGTYNPAFVTANGGTPASAEVALATCLADGKAYLNVHSTAFPGGEIRGFLLPADTAKNECKDGTWATLTDPRSGNPFRNQGQCVSFVVSERP